MELDFTKIVRGVPLRVTADVSIGHEGDYDIESFEIFTTDSMTDIFEVMSNEAIKECEDDIINHFPDGPEPEEDEDEVEEQAEEDRGQQAPV